MRTKGEDVKVEQFIVNVNSERAEELISFYKDVVGLTPGFDVAPGAFMAGSSSYISFIIEGHSAVHGPNKEPERVLLNFTVDDVVAEQRRLEARGVEVLLIGTPEPGLTVTPAAFYSEIAKEFRIPYEGEVLGKILKDGSLKADQVHPNAQGYRLMAERVYELLKKAGAL